MSIYTLNHTPSYRQGYYPAIGAPANPTLWDGLVAGWLTPLGPTGLILRNLTSRVRDGILTDIPLTAWVRPGGIQSLAFVAGSGRVDIGMQSYEAAAGSIVSSITADTVTSGFNRYFFGRNRSGNFAGDINFWVKTDGKVGFALQDGSTSSSAESNDLIDTARHVFVGTWDASETVLWQDGVKQTTTDAGIYLHPHASRGAAIGSSQVGGTGSDGGAFVGTIDTTLFYDRVLTPSEISLCQDPFALVRQRAMVFPVATAVGNPWYQYQQQQVASGV